VNWKTAPAYKLAKLLTKILRTYNPMPYSFNVKNTVQLIDDLADIPYNQKLRLASFNISNMYTNIPTEELIKIIKYSLPKEQHRRQPGTKDYKVIQNYHRSKLLSVLGQNLHTNRRVRHGGTNLLHLLLNLPTIPGELYNIQFSTKL
jgi:uncharacterized protein (DUF1697 family)